MKNSHVTRRHLLAGSIALTLGAALPTAWAQVYPDKPVKLAVGFAPGTGPTCWPAPPASNSPT